MQGSLCLFEVIEFYFQTTQTSPDSNSCVIRGRWSCPYDGCNYTTKVFPNYTYHKRKFHPDSFENQLLDLNQVEQIKTDSENVTQIKDFGDSADGGMFEDSRKADEFDTLIQMGSVANDAVDQTINRPMEVEAVDVEENRINNLILSQVNFDEDTREGLISQLKPHTEPVPHQAEEVASAGSSPSFYDIKKVFRSKE